MSLLLLLQRFSKNLVSKKRPRRDRTRITPSIVLFFVPVSFPSVTRAISFNDHYTPPAHAPLIVLSLLSLFFAWRKTSKTKLYEHTRGHIRAYFIVTRRHERLPANSFIKYVDEDRRRANAPTRLRLAPRALPATGYRNAERVRFPSRPPWNPPPPPVQHCTAPCVPPPSSLYQPRSPRSIPSQLHYKQNSPPLHSMLLVDLHPGTRDHASRPFLLMSTYKHTQSAILYCFFFQTDIPIYTTCTM